MPAFPSCRSETSETLTILRELDPTFSIRQFNEEMRDEIVPSMLEAYFERDEETMLGMCGEGVGAQLAAICKEFREKGLDWEVDLMQVGDVELVAAVVSNDAPHLMYTFSTMKTHCVRDREGEIIEGAEDEMERVTWYWAMRSDINDLEEEDFEEKDEDDEFDDGTEEQVGRDAGRVSNWKIVEFQPIRTESGVW